MRRPIVICVLLLGWLAVPAGAALQTGAASRGGQFEDPTFRTGAGSGSAADTLHLADLEERAVERDPGQRRLELQETLARVQDRSVEAGWYPSLDLRGEATYQTEVPEVGSLGPRSSTAVPSPPKDQYQIAAEVTQLLWDGGRSERRKTLNRRRLAEEQAAVESSLYALRAAVDRAFFGALIAQERAAQLEVLARDLEARKALVASRARAGAALAADTVALEAERMDVGQRIAEAESARRAAIAVLEDLTGRTIEAGAHLAAPDLASASGALARLIQARAGSPPREPEADQPERRPAKGATGADRAADRVDGAAVEELVVRPEVRRLRRTEHRLEAEARLAETADRPTVQTFVRGAFARPGLNFFDEGFGPFAVGGIRLNWSAWDWGRSDREARSLRIQSQVASSRRASIVEGIERETFEVLHEIDRLEAALKEDTRIVELRASVEETARHRLDRGVILPTQYVDRRTELFRARLNRRRHEVELTRNRVRLLRILGHSLDGARDPGLVRPLEAPGSAEESSSVPDQDDPTNR